MSSAAVVSAVRVKASGDLALRFAARLWFVLVVVGQLVFAFSVASFYTGTAVRGQWDAWNKFMLHGYVAGQPIGNGVVAVHLIAVVLLIACGALQLIPQVLRKAPKFHRWNGRVYLVSALAVSGAGLVMLFSRGSVGGTLQHTGLALDGILVWVFAALALRFALKRDFKRHRRWALRLYVVALGVYFLRVAVPLYVLLFGPLGIDLTTFTGPALVFWSYASYLLPLAMVELYLRTQDKPGEWRRWAMAVLIAVMTLGMGVGTVASASATWVPAIQRTYSNRVPIEEVMDATIASRGVDAAVVQYYSLKAASPATYNFAEDQLNDLGYKYIRRKRYDVAIRILALNVEAYPKSFNAWDSLGEAYMDSGDKALALVNYRKSVELNPKSAGGKKAIERLSR